MIPIFKPHYYKEDQKLAIQTIKEGYVTNGPHILEFEKQFATLCNRKYAVTCCNGTVALYLAVKALNLPKGSEVILPSMTIVSCLTAIVENGLKPIFCDIDKETWNIDYSSAESKITNNTSAVIVVNTYGLVVDTDKTSEFKQKYPHIQIIEDASESHGASHKGTMAGSIGDVSTFSFYANKIVTTGEGGMVLTDNEDQYKELLQLRNLHFTERRKYIHSAAGFNFRLTNLQCALGLGQLHNIDKTIAHRKRVAYKYNSFFKKNKNIQIPFENSEYSNVYWYYGIVVKKNYDKVLKALEDNNIEYRHFFYPLHKQPFIDSKEVIKNSEFSFENGILLPIFNKLTTPQMKFIAEVVLNEMQ